MKPKHKVLLVVLDGWGLRKEREANAIALAGTPQMDALSSAYPGTQLQTSGLAVGLPDGQMGNSEVGHTNMGAGRVVYQDLVRINRACENEGLHAIAGIRAVLEQCKRDGKAFHLLGLVSDGGVHSSMEHLYSLLQAAKRVGVRQVFVHAFLDGRDTAPQSAKGYLEALEERMRQEGVGKVATVHGRFYAMDRDKRWDRVEKSFNALVRSLGPKAPSALAAVQANYDAKVTDEFVEPTVVANAAGEPVGPISEGDGVMFFNFRADRAREMTRALAFPDFKEFERGRLKLGSYVCMTQYDETFSLPVAFEPEQPTHIFPQLISEAGWRQLRTAETEKYAHVTFFFNGGRELVFPGEERHLVASPRDVKTYDLKPEMSAKELIDTLCSKISADTHDFVLVNIANPDMVGHTGVMSAALKAVRVVDDCVGQLWRACQQVGWTMVVTADHGNIELMVDPVTGAPHTAHTLNPVPFLLCGDDFKGLKLKPGVLADIGPTLCKVMGLTQPPEMNRAGLL